MLRRVVKKPLNGMNGRANEGGRVSAECLVIRDEIIVAASGTSFAVIENVTIHLEQCVSCREWEAVHLHVPEEA